MATPIGTDVVTSISRRFVMPEIVDQVYRSNVLFYRLQAMNKKTVRGGFQIEVPLLYSKFNSSGFFSGFDLLDTTPQDVVKNAAFDWKEAYVTITIDGLTLIKNDSPDAIASIIRSYFEAARMEMDDRLGQGVFSDGVTNTKSITGLQAAIDNGTVAATYGGLGNRTTTNSFWQPATGALDTTTTTLTLPAMQTVFGRATEGARHPTLLIGTQSNYDRYWNLNQVHQRFPTTAMGQDEQLAKAGFTNLLFNNVPFAVDSHVNTTRAGVTGDSLYFLNEEYIQLVVSSRRDMVLEDFLQPVNQDAMTAKLLWAGELVFSNIARQGLMSALTA